MKILILSNKLPYPPKDGGSIATLNLALGYSQLENSVDLLAINTSKHYFDIAKIPEELSKQINFYSVFVDTQIRIFKALSNLLFSKKPYNAQRFIDKEYASKLKDLLTKKSYDLIQLEGLYMAPYLSLIRENTDALVSMRSHNVEHKIWEKHAQLTRNPFKRFYLKVLTSRIKAMELGTMNNFDSMVTITPNDADFFRTNACTIPLFSMPVGINYTDYTADHSGMDKSSLFHIGALDWMPNSEGLDWFFKYVWLELKKSFPDLKFYLAGRNAPESFVNSLNYEDVVYLGEVEDAQKFIQQNAIMIVPLFSGSGMRIKILEGLALEKVIVSTSLGAEGIPATDGENILIANTSTEFVDKISEVLNNRKKFSDISHEAGVFVRKNFDTFTLTKGLLSFYKKLAL